MVKKAQAGIVFGSLGDYSVGGGFPEGDYALAFECVMYDYPKKDGTPSGYPASLTVKVTCHPLNNPELDVKEQYYGMGKKAHESYQPNPDNGGKGLVVVPNGPGAPLYLSTNWGILLKSLYDSGLPEGVFSNDFTALDGMHVHMKNVPEPEERKSFRSQLNEGGEERKNKTIAIVSEIKEDGMPWEGTGGIPGTEEAPAPKAGAKKTAAPAAKAPAKTTAKTAPKPTPTASDDAVQDAALSAISTVLGANEKGMSKLALRVAVHKQVKAEADDETASSVVDTYFTGDDDVLGNLLGEMGFQLAGNMVKPV